MNQQTNQQTPPIPVTVLSGYLGAGKTTILNHLLRERHGYRIAVIVNDMSEINVDGALIAQAGHLSRTEEALVEMTNGCICCTLREDLLVEVKKLAQEGRFDYILIESTGISEPVPVAQTFVYQDEETGIDLTPFARLDTMVTVVDAARFWNDFASGESLLARQQALGEDDTREVVDLLIDQIEFCDVLILNKCDLVEEDRLQQLEALLRKLQPQARFVRAARGAVDPQTLLNTRLFDFDRASQSAGWLQELKKEAHTPETEEYGISSFVYRARRPFHSERFHAFVMEWPEEIVRAKGTVWFATRNDWAGLLSQAGPTMQLQAMGQWLATLPEAEQTEMRQTDPDAFVQWQEPYGDRMIELVLIGVDMDREVVSRQLDRLLLTDDEMATDWTQLADPLPQWQEEGQSIDEYGDPVAHASSAPTENNTPEGCSL